ncbi:MAG: hypothetical protein AB1439_09985 [candidate division FCPU426 bacterium]
MSMRPGVGCLLAAASLAVGLVAQPSPACAEEALWVEAAVNTRLVKCGEPFKLVLTAGARNGVVKLPGKTAVIPSAQILAYDERDVSARHEGYVARQGVYRLAFFTTEDIVVPPLPVWVQWADGSTATAFSWPERLGLLSLRPEAGLSLIDPRPPRRSLNVIGTVALAVVLLAAGMRLLMAGRRRPKRKAVQPPAHLEAVKQLEALGASPVVASAELSREYFTALSRIVRRYLAQRYRFPALELARTTILARLESAGVEAKRRELIDQLLSETDLVKYAQEPADNKRVAAAHGLAKEIIRLTRESQEANA